MEFKIYKYDKITIGTCVDVIFRLEEKHSFNNLFTSNSLFEAIVVHKERTVSLRTSATLGEGLANVKTKIESEKLFSLSLGRGQGEDLSRREALRLASDSSNLAISNQVGNDKERITPCERSEQNNLLSYYLIHSYTFSKGGVLC